MIIAEELAQSKGLMMKLLWRNVSAVYSGALYHHYCNVFNRFVLQVGSNVCELRVWKDGGMSHSQHMFINKQTVAFMYKSQTRY